MQNKTEKYSACIGITDWTEDTLSILSQLGFKRTGEHTLKKQLIVSRRSSGVLDFYDSDEYLNDKRLNVFSYKNDISKCIYGISQLFPEFLIKSGPEAIFFTQSKSYTPKCERIVITNWDANTVSRLLELGFKRVVPKTFKKKLIVYEVLGGERRFEDSDFYTEDRMKSLDWKENPEKCEEAFRIMSAKPYSLEENKINITAGPIAMGPRGPYDPGLIFGTSKTHISPSMPEERSPVKYKIKKNYPFSTHKVGDEIENDENPEYRLYPEYFEPVYEEDIVEGLLINYFMKNQIFVHRQSAEKHAKAMISMLKENSN